MSDLLIRREVLSKLEGIKKNGAGYKAICPCHDDHDPSLQINIGRDQPVVMYCQVCGARGDQVAEAAGIDWKLVSNPREASPRRSNDDTFMVCGLIDGAYDRNHRKVDEYQYQRPDRSLAFAVARCELKGIRDENGKKRCEGFRQWRPDPTSRSGKRWSLTLPDGTKVGEGLIYRLPDIIDSNALHNVYIVEGEKDANRLWSMGIPATCNAEGAGKWTPAHADWLAGRDVMIVADRDEGGRKHAVHVAETLMEIADSIEILQSAHGKDMSDHLDAGGTLATLLSVEEVKPLVWPGVNA